MRHLQTYLVIFADNSCIFAYSLIIWPNIFEKMESSWNSIVQHSSFCMPALYTTKWIRAEFEKNTSQVQPLLKALIIYRITNCRLYIHKPLEKNHDHLSLLIQVWQSLTSSDPSPQSSTPLQNLNIQDIYSVTESKYTRYLLHYRT